VLKPLNVAFCLFTAAQRFLATATNGGFNPAAECSLSTIHSPQRLMLTWVWELQVWTTTKMNREALCVHGRSFV
jgi:hypothetical protein